MPHATSVRGFTAWFVLALIAVANFGNFYVYDSIGPVADLLERQRGFTDTEIGMLNAVYSLPNIVLLVVGGMLVDRLGAGRMMLWTAAICFAGALRHRARPHVGRAECRRLRTDDGVLLRREPGGIRIGRVPVAKRGQARARDRVQSSPVKKALNVAITGAAGQIGYALAFRVASGQMLGTDQPVSLHLLEITPALPALSGVVMELADCAFPTLDRIVATDDARSAFRDCDIALLVGARPRGPGMERKDLLLANAQIFSAQGRALNEVADRDVRVLVVGNPANTNALIAASNAPDLARRNFTAMMRLDHNRALAQLAEKTGSRTTAIRRMVVWGNHSATQHPDISHCTVDGKPAKSLVETQWYREVFIPTVQQRGAAVIKARGASSAASAASAAIDHVRDWALGTPANDWVSMAVPSDGSYGIGEGVVYAYPVTCKGGRYEIVQGLAIDEFSRARMDATHRELLEEREGVRDLI